MIRPQADTAGERILYSMPTDDWLHLYLYHIADGTLTQVTRGEFEDAGHEAEVPHFSGDGRQIVWSSNRGNLLERQLWTCDLISGTQRQITRLPGTSCDPSFSPDGSAIAFVHAGPYESADIWVVGADGSHPRQLSRSMPETWTREKIAEPMHVTYPGVKGLQIHADVWLPKGFDPAKKYPALVFVHGGQTRQMRYGWHPMQSYALFYSFNQYLLHHGYVVCSVDYRGGTGFGQEYLEATYLSMGIDDAADVADSAQMLAELGYVDPKRIGVWGLSYGGYMTLACLTRHPETFALGVNIAGLWDFTQWQDYWRSLYQDIHFTRRLGGPLGPETREYYENASPRTMAHQLTKPLLNLMGTADERVDFAQFDSLVSDLTRLGKPFELMYYPGETHSFTHRHTWRDAFGRMIEFFDRYLKR
jgi:dipeptidyl aminopeptidase/acylaminoacyl peptidase